MKLAFAPLFVLALATFASAADLIKPIPAVGFCKKGGFKAADGTQNKTPNAKECVSLPIGQLPAVNKMISTIIVSPRNGQTFQVNQTFTVVAKINNLQAGFFSDPDFDYYQIPQTLNGDGIIQGHSHITIQRLNGNNVPDPTVFQFFKGLNDPEQNGELNTPVATGLPTPGEYRICTMNASNSHQPVVMPVAQRGAQDDCIRITVVPKRGGRRRH